MKKVAIENLKTVSTEVKMLSEFQNSYSSETESTTGNRNSWQLKVPTLLLPMLQLRRAARRSGCQPV